MENNATKIEIAEEKDDEEEDHLETPTLDTYFSMISLLVLLNSLESR